MDPQLGEGGTRQGLLRRFKVYLALDSGGLHNPPEIRHKATLIQFGLLFLFTILVTSTNYWLDTTGFSWIFSIFMVVFFWIVFLYILAAFFISVKDNVPRMVKTKHTIGLFLYTLLFFESLVMSILFWILYAMLWFLNSRLCTGLLCHGLVSGIVIYANILFVICFIVLVRSKRSLGISISDAFGVYVNIQFLSCGECSHCNLQQRFCG
eukprot:TRINITY_DN108_c3_g1_i3.p1 TRINITY_DN108_c3_g1~~TRINITY_DN108_c3_g1_i3.p1  ORF type:complete len:209 (-),score=10.04 TRINITY_DN108_c3_g1_i3:33-659(-)